MAQPPHGRTSPSCHVSAGATRACGAHYTIWAMARHLCSARSCGRHPAWECFSPFPFPANSRLAIAYQASRAPRQRLRQVLGEEAGTVRPAAGAVQPDGGGGGFERRMPCAARPETRPASTSPEPAVASQGGRSKPMVARPSGAATTVSAPLINTTAPMSRAGNSGARELIVLEPDVGRALEEPRELALVRVNTAECPPRAMSAARRAASQAKLVSASASSTIVRRSRAGSAPPREFAQRRTGARAGAERDRAPSLVGEQRLEFAYRSERRDHHRGQVRGVDGDRVGRARQVTMPAPERSAARAASRAAPVRCAGARQDQNRAAGVLVAFGAHVRERPRRRRAR